MSDMQTETRRAAQHAIEEVNEGFNEGIIPVDARGDRAFVEEIAKSKFRSHVVDEEFDWDEVDESISTVLDEEFA